MILFISVLLFGVIVVVSAMIHNYHDRRAQKKEEQKKMWEVLKNQNTSGNSGVDTSPIPRRKYRI